MLPYLLLQMILGFALLEVVNYLEQYGQALVIREGSRLLDAVEQTIAAHADDPLAALTAGLKRFLTIATTDPFVRLLLGDDGTGGLLPLLTTRAVPPRLGSHVTAPPDPPARTAAAVTRLLAASIERMLEALPT